MAKSSGGIKAGKAFVEIYGDDTKLQTTLRSMSAKLKTWGAGLQSLGLGMMKTGSLITAPLLGAVKMFIDTGDELDKMSTKTGISVEALSRLGFAAGQSDVSLQDLGTAIRFMQKNLSGADEEGKAAVKTLARLGLTIGDLTGLKPDEQFKRIADAIAGIEDPTKRAAATMAIFGKAGTDLLPMLANGRRGIEALERECDRLGLTMSTADAQAAGKLDDALKQLWAQLKRGAVLIGASLAPALTELAGTLSASVAKATSWLSMNRELVTAYTLSIAKIGAITIGLGAATSAIGKTVTAAASLNTAVLFLIANPVIAGIAAVGAAFIGLGFAIKAAGDYSADLRTWSAEILTMGDQQRSQDIDKMARLTQLAGKEALNNSEMQEARTIITALQAQYGDLGLSMDRATGKIIGMTAAQREFNSLVRQARVEQLSGAIIEQKDNIRALVGEITGALTDVQGVSQSSGLANIFIGGGDVARGKLEAALRKNEAAQAKLKSYELELKAYKGGELSLKGQQYTMPEKVEILRGVMDSVRAAMPSMLQPYLPDMKMMFGGGGTASLEGKVDETNKLLKGVIGAVQGKEGGVFAE